MDGNITIRKAVIDDCDRLMELMKELAKHENEIDLMQLSPEDLRRDGFGENPHFGCVVAELTNSEHEKTIIGYALYFNTYSPKVGKCIYMEDIYVQPEYRRKRVGQQIFREVMKVANNSGCYRLHWGCLEWNRTAMEFYKGQNAVDVTNPDHHIFHIDQPELAKNCN